MELLDTVTMNNLSLAEQAEWENVCIETEISTYVVEYLLDKLRPNTSGTLTKPLLEHLIAGGMSHSDIKATYKLSYRQIQDMLNT